MRIILQNLGLRQYALDIGDWDFGHMVRPCLAPYGHAGDSVDIGSRVDPFDLNVQKFIRGLVVPPGSTRTLTAVSGGYEVTATPAGQCKVTFLEDTDDLAFLFFAGLGGDHKVAVSGTDTTPNFLRVKLAAGAGISLSILNSGGNEQVQITATGGGSLPPATAVGQTLFSIDGLTFTPEQPLTGPGGWLVNSQGILLVKG